MTFGKIFLITMGVIFGALVSVHVFSDSEPEFFRITSTDGSLMITGSVYAAQTFSFHEALHDVVTPPLLLERYTFLPEDILFAQPLVATLVHDAHRVLYFLDPVRGYAVPLPKSSRSSLDDSSSFLLSRGGTYALGEELRVDVPTFVDVITAMRLRLPEYAVSYSLRMVVTPKDGAAVLLPHALEVGGCGGLPFASQEILTAEDQRIVHVLVNDVLTEVTFTFLMDIGVAPAGCPEDMPLSVLF